MSPESDNLVRLRSKRLDLERWLESRGLLHTVSLARHNLHEHLAGLIRRYGRSPLLDVGSGLGPFDRLCDDLRLRIVRLDAQARNTRVDIIGDVQNMIQVADESFATVLCSQVIEHVPDPPAALREMARVLEPGGVLILSAPHLSLLHEVPNDYWRFTRYGLEQLLRKASLEVLSVEPTAGIFGFAGHLFSLAWMMTAGAVPGFRRAAWRLNTAVMVGLLGRLDRRFGAAGVLPCDYVAVARKGKY